MVRKHIRIGWWRGFAFGVVVRCRSFPADLHASLAQIDGRDNPRGTWQWSLIISESARPVVGVHMWAYGWLSGLFDEVLAGYRAAGYRVSVRKKEKDRLMKFLTRVCPMREYHPPPEA